MIFHTENFTFDKSRSCLFLINMTRWISSHDIVHLSQLHRTTLEVLPIDFTSDINIPFIFLFKPLALIFLLSFFHPSISFLDLTKITIPAAPSQPTLILDIDRSSNKAALPTKGCIIASLLWRRVACLIFLCTSERKEEQRRRKSPMLSFKKRRGPSRRDKLLTGISSRSYYTNTPRWLDGWRWTGRCDRKGVLNKRITRGAPSGITPTTNSFVSRARDERLSSLALAYFKLGGWLTQCRRNQSRRRLPSIGPRKKQRKPRLVRNSAAT